MKKLSRPKPRATSKTPAAKSLAAKNSETRIPIEELARQTGLTVRHIREFQARGLLAPPELEGRRGLYNTQHLARVALVRRLQDRGYSLAGIGDLLQRWTEGTDISEVLGLENAMLTPAAGTPHRLARKLSQPALERLLPELVHDAELRARAMQIELVSELEGALHAPDAELIEIARAFVDGGIPLAALLDEMSELRADAERIAGRFRDMFTRHYMAALQREGIPAERIGELSSAIAKLRPLGPRATTILLAQAIERGGPTRR